MHSAISALRDRTRFQVLLYQITAAAFGTFLRNGLTPSDEVTLRIAVATVESSTALGPPLNDFALRAIGTRHADGLLLDELAFRIITASHELAVAPEFLHQVAIAIGALLFERDVFALLAANLLRRFAIGVAGAGEELSKAAFFEHHRTAAVLAVLLLVLLRQIGAIGIG